MIAVRSMVPLLLLVALMVACVPKGRPGEITPLDRGGQGQEPSEPSPAGEEPKGGGEAVISSDGTQVPAAPEGSSQPGTVEGSQRTRNVETDAESPAVAPQTPTGKWLAYSNAAYGFALRYPDSYVVLPEPSTLPEETPRLVYTVRFQDKDLAVGETANLELPQFTVDVLEMAQTMPLGEWLRSTGQAPADATAEAVRLRQAGEAWRVAHRALMAPNTFYYVAGSKYVYRLTPLGPYSEEMLASFQLLPGK